MINQLKKDLELISFNEKDFKVGDKVKIVRYINYDVTEDVTNEKINEEVIIVSIDFSDKFPFSCDNGRRFMSKELELISSDETNKQRTIKMKLNNMMKRLLAPEVKKLIQGDIIDGDLELTESGKKALTALVFGTYKEELVKIAEEKIKEEKEEEKN